MDIEASSRAKSINSSSLRARSYIAVVCFILSGVLLSVIAINPILHGLVFN